jgi:hypothetical protein
MHVQQNSFLENNVTSNMYSSLLLTSENSCFTCSKHFWHLQGHITPVHQLKAWNKLNMIDLLSLPLARSKKSVLIWTTKRLSPITHLTNLCPQVHTYPSALQNTMGQKCTHPSLSSSSQHFRNLMQTVFTFCAPILVLSHTISTPVSTHRCKTGLP